MKLWKIASGLMLGASAVFAAGAWSKFGDKVKAASSVRKLEEGLYTLEFRGDHGFDEFLRRGGAASEGEMAAYVSDFLSGGMAKAAPPKQDFGCSTLHSGHLLGRNFDWEGKDGPKLILRLYPKHGYASVSTCWLDFLGFGEGWKPEGFANQYMALAAMYVPLDGMNEQGLCVADLVNGDDEQTHQQTGKASLTTNTAIRLLLDRAADVEEALALLEQYDMNSAIGMAHHLAISDAKGRSVVVEYVDGEMLVIDAQAVTNHYLCPGEKQGMGNEESHSRHKKLCGLAPEIRTPEQMKSAMEAVSYSGLTRWTIVFDQQARTMEFFQGCAFDRPHHFNVAEG